MNRKGCIFINYTFCKKDGTIKKHYIDVCQYIIKAQMQNHEVIVGRYDKVINSYSCYTTSRKELCAKDKRSYKNKIKEICSNFNIKTKEWYSCNSLLVELHGNNVEQMINELKNLLGGVNHIR